MLLLMLRYVQPEASPPLLLLLPERRRCHDDRSGPVPATEYR